MIRFTMESMNRFLVKRLFISPFNNLAQSNALSTINLPLDAIQIYLPEIPATWPALPSANFAELSHLICPSSSAAVISSERVPVPINRASIKRIRRFTTSAPESRAARRNGHRQTNRHDGGARAIKITFARRRPESSFASNERHFCPRTTDPSSPDKYSERHRLSERHSSSFTNGGSRLRFR